MYKSTCTEHIGPARVPIKRIYEKQSAFSGLDEPPITPLSPLTLPLALLESW